MDYVTIDFEASCLPRHGLSFPIEVGIADHLGSRAWLIRPAAGWNCWDWTEEALALHGIAPADLDRNGLPAHQVFAELNQAIAGRRLIADNRLDQYWWRLLAGAAGEELHSPVELVGTILDEMGVLSEDVFAAQHHADDLCPARHRAGDDALWLWTLLSELHRNSEQVAPADVPFVPRRGARAQPSLSGGMAA